MMDHQVEWMIEFTQPCEDGGKVVKRGLDATPMVIKKYGIEPDEVMAFTCWQGRKKAITAFHFHPDFPDAARRRYMEVHDDGREVMAGVMASMEAERRQRMRDWNERTLRTAAAARRTLGAALSALALTMLHGHLR